jgi:hypothetical protein
VNSHDPGIIRQAIALISLKAQVSAYSTVFITSAVLVGIGAVFSFWIRLKRSETGETKNAEVFVE